MLNLYTLSIITFFSIIWLVWILENYMSLKFFVQETKVCDVQTWCLIGLYIPMSWNHRINWIGSDLKTHLFPHPDMGRDTLLLDQVVPKSGQNSKFIYAHSYVYGHLCHIYMAICKGFPSLYIINNSLCIYIYMV